MGRRCALVVGTFALVAAACGDPADAPAPPTTGTTVGYEPAPEPPPIKTPEWFPRWEEPVLTDGPLGAGSVSGVAAGPGGVIAYGEQWEGEALVVRVAFSADGATWEPAATLGPHRVAAVAAGGAGYVMVGGRFVPHDAPDGASRLEPAAWWSADGRTWNEAAVDMPADAGVPAVFREADYETLDGSWIEDVVFEGEIGFAVGRSAGGARNVVWTSRDGRSWQEVEGTPLGGPAHVRRITAGATSYVALGAEDPRGHDPGPVAMWRSPDGVAWEQVASFDPGAGPLPAQVVRLRGGYVAIGHEGHRRPVAWVSPDGVEWSGPAALQDGESATVLAVAGGGEMVVAAGAVDGADGRTAPALWLSEDGVRWAVQAAPDDQPESLAEAVAWLHDHWLVLGRAWGLPGGAFSGMAWTGR